MLSLKKNKAIFFLEAFLLFLLMSMIWILSCVPPVSRDALVHHLAVPKIYLFHGKMIELPCMVFSYYPMNLDMIYTIALYLGSDIAPKYIHGLFGLMTAGLIYRYLKKRINRVYALGGVLLFLTVPIIVRLSIIAYVDLGLVFFSTMALLLIVKWVESGFLKRYLCMSGVLCGLAMGTKYNGLIVFFLLTMSLPVIISRQSNRRSQSRIRLWAWPLVFIMISGAVFSPWMVRNIVWKGNPIFPLYSSFFKADTDNLCELSSDQTKGPELTYNKFAYRLEIYQESLAEVVLLPIRFFYQGQDNNAQYFDGKLSLVLLVFPFFAFFRCREKEPYLWEKYLYAWYSILFFLFAFFSGPLRVRYLAPVIPFLVILSIYGLQNAMLILTQTSNKAAKILCLTLVLSGFGYTVFHSGGYLIQTFDRVKPFQYLNGQLSRDEYIEQFRPEYPVFRYMNDNLSEDSKILFFFLGGRGYYCDREYIPDQNYNLFMVFELIRAGKTAEEISKWFQQKKITHFLFNYRLVQEQVDRELNPLEQKVFFRFISTLTTEEYVKNGFGLHALGQNK